MSSIRQILVCGGAGYIGSHMCKLLALGGYAPVVFDNFSTGHRWAVKWGPLVEGDLLDVPALEELFAGHSFDAVMHFAARSQVAESVLQPSMYYRNNVVGTLNLLDAMRNAGVRKLIFSSSAAVYGNPQYMPIDEQHPCSPINPYGHSKLMAERIIGDACRDDQLNAVCLRYFNAAGADADGEIGEAHDPETHLIPNIIKVALNPDAPPLTIFGTDYPTGDGSCIRDYIHVEDICDAHLAALNFLSQQSGCNTFNLGTATGCSVHEIIGACEQLIGRKIQVHEASRRTGDPAILIAKAEAAKKDLGFSPRRSINDILASALHWHATARME
jgi:UDP-glucose 4-epimerase